MRYPLLLLTLATFVCRADDEPVVFRSDVALARVDAQVVDGHNRTITGLRATDFVLRENGKVVPIRNFASENMPIDILLLLDVSASMRPHVERISNAAHDALRVLSDKDRMAIMVFDTYTRTRMGFRSSHDEINSGLSDVLRQERFNGGTRITRAMISAAEYVQREARPEARRAIVILTDDGSQDARDDAGVGRALARADAVLSFLRAPDLFDQQHGGGRSGRGYPGTGTTWPGGGNRLPGGGWPGSGPVILGGGGGRRGAPGGGTQVRNHSAGTADIAKDSGGDTFPVDDASALEETLLRLRQRYALFFNSSADVRGSVMVDLADATRRRYADAEIRYRRVSITGSSREAGPVSITRAHPTDARGAVSGEASSPANGAEESTTPKRRRVAVDPNYGSGVNVQPKSSSEQPQ
jgi:VWFA-related protein